MRAVGRGTSLDCVPSRWAPSVPDGLAPALERSVRAVLRTGNPEHAAESHVAWVQRNGVRPWVDASVAHQFHPCWPIRGARRPSLPTRACTPAPAFHSCQMLAALKNVLARLDASRSSRSSIAPPSTLAPHLARRYCICPQPRTQVLPRPVDANLRSFKTVQVTSYALLVCRLSLS